MAREQPPQRPPAVQRLRIRYGKVGPLRFASHRDIARTLERAVRRAGLPVAYSSGFSPHPRLSYANPAPTGAASCAEYVEIGLTAALDPAQVRALLTDALSPGLPVTSVVEAAPGEKLAEALTASVWRIEWAVPAGRADAAFVDLRAAGVAEVRRESARGLRVLDVAAALRAGTVDADEDGLSRLRVLLSHGEPLVRPDDVVRALAERDAELATAPPPRYTRLAQGVIQPPGDRTAVTVAGVGLCLPPGEDDPGRC